jgi:NADH:ubiquinone oxidoreductase subunit E
LAACRALADHAVELLGIPFGGTTDDGLVRLTRLRCRELPGTKSIAMIDDEAYSIESAEQLGELLNISRVASASD